MANSGENTGNSFMLKICAFIVDKRNLFFLIYIILGIFAVVTKSWVGVENDLAFYLPSESETRQGLDLMEEQFVTYGTAKFMVGNVTYEEAEKFAEKNYLMYCETSSKDGINVEDAFEMLTKNIIDKEVLNNSKVMSLSSVKAVKGKMKNEFSCC